MPTVLVIEDDPIARNLIVQVMTKLGFRVFEADNATEAMIVCNAIRNQALDLVIADPAIRPGGGRTVTDEIREMRPNVKVLHLARPSAGSPQEGGLLSASWFLEKPFTGGQLADAVQNILTPRPQ